MKDSLKLKLIIESHNYMLDGDEKETLQWKKKRHNNERCSNGPALTYVAINLHFLVVNFSVAVTVGTVVDV